MAYSVGYLRTTVDGVAVVLQVAVLAASDGRSTISTVVNGRKIQSIVPSSSVRSDPGEQVFVPLPPEFEASDAESRHLDSSAWEEPGPSKALESSVLDLSKLVKSLAEDVKILKRGATVPSGGGGLPSSSRDGAPRVAPRTSGLDSLLGAYAYPEAGPQTAALDADDGDSGSEDSDSPDEGGDVPEDFTLGLGLGQSGPKAAGVASGRTRKARVTVPPQTSEEAMCMIAATQAEIAKTMKKLRRGSGSSSSDSGRNKPGKFGRPKRLKRKVYRFPQKLINEWLTHVKADLRGGQAGNPWCLTAYSEKLRRSFGQNWSLVRCHHLISVVLDVMLLEKKILPGIALLITVTQAIHEAAMANGRWGLAMTYTPIPDPLAVPSFAGRPEDVDDAATYYDNLTKVTEKTRPKAQAAPRRLPASAPGAEEVEPTAEKAEGDKRKDKRRKGKGAEKGATDE